MKKVLVKSIELHYFKGTKSIQVEFNEETTVISGPNGCGKSTIADAFTWCLFGKNMRGESDTKFQIKTVDNHGDEIPHVNHEVKLELIVDGMHVMLRRVLVPEYDKEDNLTGNHTEYYWNDVPCKKSEYDAKVKEIIDEQVFKMITSPFAFLTMDWKKQREMLMNMAGDTNDIDIASRSDEFTELLGLITGKTLDEYRKELNCKIQRVNDEMVAIPVRVDELRRGIPDVDSADVLEVRKAALEAELKKLEEEDINESSILDGEISKFNEQYKEISELEQKRCQILSDAEIRERAEIHEYNLAYDVLDKELREIESEDKTDASMIQKLRKDTNDNIAFLRSKMESIDTQLSKMRDEWTSVNATRFECADTLKCPIYGHQCNDGHACDQFRFNNGNAREAFLADKKNRLGIITGRGKAIAEEKDSILKDIEKLNEDFRYQSEDYDFRSTERHKRMADIKKKMSDSPRKPLIATVKGEDIQEWVELGKVIEDKKASVGAKPIREVNAERELEKERIKSDISAVVMNIALRSRRDSDEKRIEDLESHLRELGAEKSILENRKRIADEFEIAKMDEVGKKVNAKFGIVEWRMFQRQVNGETVPACIALVGGVRWDCANTASMINAGIDVADSLSQAYGVSAPVFIDNSESVGCIYNPGMQQIQLKFDSSNSHIKVY